MPDELIPVLRPQTGGKAILDEHGHPFAVCRSPEDAVRVAAMLNAHSDLLAACEKAEEFVKYSLEFWDWRNFPNLEESAQLLATQLREAKAKAKGGAA